MVTPEPGRGRLRTSHADREQVVDVLKAAFVQGRLTQDELDTRVGQALAARTYADLASLTADLPAEPDRAAAAVPAPVPAAVPAPAPAQIQAHNRSARRAVKFGAGMIAAVILVTSGTAAVLGQPAAALIIPIAIVLFTAFPAAFVAALIALALKAESWHRNHSRGQLPPGPASGADGRTSPRPASPRPPASGPARPRPRRPHGLLAIGRAG